MIDLNLERLKRLPQNPTAVWEGGWRALPNISIATDQTPQDYQAGLWTCLESHAVGPRGDMLQPSRLATPEKLFELLVIFACDNDLAGYRPSLVRVDNKETALFLAEKLKGTEIEVAQASDLPTLDDLASHLASHLAGGGENGNDPLSILAASELTMEQIIDYGHAAAEFHKSAPWNVLSDVDLISIVSPEAGLGLGHATILGGAGLEFGLGFFSDPAQHDAAQSGASHEEIMNRPDPIWFFSYTERGERDHRHINREWSNLGLPLDSESAYPLFLCRLPDGRPQKPGPGELNFLAGLLRALARSTVDQMDTGRWSVTVPTLGGDVEYRLELPYVLKPLDLSDRVRWNIPLDSRRNYCLPEAHDAVGYYRQVLARRALRENPDSVDALALLAEETGDLARQLELCHQTITTGRRVLPLEAWATNHTDLVEVPQARSYLRTLALAVDLLKEAGDGGQILEYGLEFLRLHPHDTGNLRHIVLPELLVTGRNEEARALLDNWPGLEEDEEAPPLEDTDFMTGNGDLLLLDVAGILLDLRDGVPANEMTKRVEEITKVNRYLWPLLTKGKQPPGTSKQSFALGGGLVASFIGMILKEAWDQTPETAQFGGGGGGAAKAKGGAAKKKKKKR